MLWTGAARAALTQSVGSACCRSATAAAAAGLSTSVAPSCETSSSSSSFSSSGGSSQDMSNCVATSSSTTTINGSAAQCHSCMSPSQPAAPATAAGPGPGSTRLFAQLAASTGWPTGLGWHQRHAAAAYRAPIKGKQGAKQGSSGKGGGGAAAAAAPSPGASAAAAFDDDGPGAGDAVRVVLQAIANITPHLDVRTIRTATKTTYVPGVMPPDKGRSLALHWLVAAAQARKKTSAAPFAECLALELLLAYQKRGPARQKRDDLHKLALQNRANLHLRWW